MPRRVSDTFKAGMITDVIGAEGSVFELKDMYVRRAGELCARGPIRSFSATASNIGYNCGWSQAIFHPNMGVAACRGAISSSSGSRHISDSTRYNLMGAGLQSAASATALSFTPVTEGPSASVVPLHAGVTSAATAATGLSFEKTVQMSNAGNEVIMAGELGSLYKWGGSLLAPYGTGTVAVATSLATTSRIITGTGTTWGGGLVQAGQYILIDGIAEKANTFQRAFRITKVVSNTQIEIELPVYTTGTATGLTYRIQSCAVIQSPDGVWNQTDERPRQVGVVAYHQGKCWTAGTSDLDTAYNTVYNFDRIRWSGNLDEVSGLFNHLDLWHADAYIDVFPGIGGSIRGLVSIGSELVIIKSHGMFRLTGKVNYDGTGDGLDLQIISADVGANGFNAWALTSRGLVVASRDGLYLYDGQKLESLTDGKVKRWWEANYVNKEFSVTQYEDKIIVTPVYFSFANSSKLVWDSELNNFWTIQTNDWEYVSGLSTYTYSDEWVSDYSFEGGFTWSSASAANTYHIHDIGNINHKKGFDTYRFSTDTNGSTLPKPSVVTQSFPLGSDQLSEGRVNNILVHSSLSEGVAQGSAGVYDIAVSLKTGNSYSGITNQFSSAEHYGETYEMEYGIKYEYNEKTERVHRIPVDSMEPAPSSSVRIDSQASFGTNSANDGLSMRIYAIGIDFEPTEVQGPTS